MTEHTKTRVAPYLIEGLTFLCTATVVRDPLDVPHACHMANAYNMPEVALWIERNADAYRHGVRHGFTPSDFRVEIRSRGNSATGYTVQATEDGQLRCVSATPDRATAEQFAEALRDGEVAHLEAIKAQEAEKRERLTEHLDAETPPAVTVWPHREHRLALFPATPDPGVFVAVLSPDDSLDDQPLYLTGASINPSDAITEAQRWIEHETA